MKKFLNNPADIMEEMLEGMALANQKILYWEKGTHRIMRRSKKETGKVKIIIGNGGGHEPGSIGWIGYGMYDMASMGDVFAAQSGKQLYESIRTINDGSPIFLTIANHAGDVMNGNMAVRYAKRDGIEIESSIFYDDIVSAPKETPEERRGLTGMFFGVKMAGAVAEEGGSLQECVRAFEKARTFTRSLSLVTSGCTHPQTGMVMSELPDDIVNIGAGVHGEGGSENVKFTTSKDLAKRAIDMLLADMPVSEGEEVIILVNGMGSTTMMELAIFYQDTYKYLKQMGINVYDGIADSLFTTQETGGITLSICKIDPEMKQWWDAPCQTISYIKS